MITLGSLTRSVVASAFIVLFMVLIIPAPAEAQQAIIEGTVTSALTGQPLPGANVMIRGTTIGTATNADGFYRMTLPLAQVTGEEETLVASFVGYRSRTATLTLTAATHTVNFDLAEDVLGLEDVVVTGVLGATFKERLPFTVDIVSRTELEQAPHTSAEQAIRGRVPGALIVKGSGQPGTAASVQLRGATSINFSGRTNAPLYIVDGVILAASSVDVDALEIETIEIVKGAAAASLYGARAAAGVISINTRRGADMALDQSRITFRNEIGANELQSYDSNVAQSHAFRVNANNQYVDADGNMVENWEDPGSTRIVDVSHSPATILGPGGEVLKQGTAQAFAVNRFPRYQNHLERYFDPGLFLTNTVTVQQRTANTNFLASLSNHREAGVLWGNDGYERQTVRLNLDHRIQENLTLSLSSSYANSWRDDIASFPRPFFGIAFMAPDADLERPNPDGQPYNIQPDPVTIEENPLYTIFFNESEHTRTRVMGSGALRWAPTDWFNAEANFSYDRSNRKWSRYWPLGFKTINATQYNVGTLQKDDAFDEAINASITANFTHNFGLLATRTQLRYLLESSEYQWLEVGGNTFAVPEIPTFGNLSNIDTPSSGLQLVRGEGYYFITGLDYDGRYILDFLVRRDGSSLFGPDERWHNYYRISAAYRMAQEAWWPLQDVNEFKVRYSLGTAGGRPSFSAQYETYSVSAGRIVKGTLGNRELKPEFSTEQEMGLEVGLFDRFLLDLTYANTVTEDQILPIPLPGVFGFGSQWQNAGTLESNTFEASFRAYLIQQRDMRLSATLLYDRTRQEITKFDRPAYRTGPGLQASDVFYMREGEEYGAIYGFLWISGTNQLPADLQQYADYFDVNDDGYLVAVGQGRSFKDGWVEDANGNLVHRFWGTSVVLPSGHSFGWGMPIRYTEEDGNQFVRIGKVVPDYSLSLATNFQYKNLTLYALFDGQFGGDIYSQTRAWGIRENKAPEVDQRDKPRENWKPLTYYASLYAANQSSSHFVEKGDYVKLRELSVRYSFDRAQLRPLFGGWVNRITLGVIGRNLLTFTDYSGFDPEVGAGAATLFRFDAFAYPNYRTYTAIVEIEF